MNYLCITDQVAALATENEGILGYVSRQVGFVNREVYLTKPLSFFDVKNHATVIMYLLKHHQEHALKFGDKVMLSTLFELLLNGKIKFIQNPVYKSF